MAEQRRAIARDVHDGLAQELAFLATQLQQLDAGAPDPDLVEELRGASRRALVESRLMVDALRAPADQPFGVLIQQAVFAFGARFGVVVDLELELPVAEPARAAANRDRQTALLRILGQALANAVEHGAARRVRVRLHGRDGGLSLLVSDDGSGFAPAAAAPAAAGRERDRPRRGWGLISMRERAEVLGGSFSVSTRPGHGTDVAVVLP